MSLCLVAAFHLKVWSPCVWIHHFRISVFTFQLIFPFVTLKFEAKTVVFLLEYSEVKKSFSSVKNATCVIRQVTVWSRESQKSSAKKHQCNIYSYIIACNYTHAPGNYRLWLLDPSRVIRQHLVIQQKAKPTSMRKAKWLLFRNVVRIL